MAAPSGTQWGDIVNDYGRLGIYAGIATSNSSSTVTIDIWFWSKYSVVDNNNTYHFDNEATSATTNRGAVAINHGNDSTAWSTENQTKIGSYTYTYAQTDASQTKWCAARLRNVDVVNGQMYATASYTIPAFAVYTITYYDNGGSGAPASQTKEYNKAITLSTVKPTRTGYSFLGWSTSSTATSASYSPGATYSTNANLKLYAVWKAYTYTISYDANGGAGAPGDQIKTYGVTLTLSSIMPVRPKYVFRGWATSPIANSSTYAAGGDFTLNANTTLYAVWGSNYTKPRITDLSIYRTDNDGISSDGGPRFSVSFNWATDYDVSAITLSLRLSTSDSWLYQTDVTSIFGASGTSGTSSGTGFGASSIYGDDLDSNSSYIVEISVSDIVDSTVLDVTLPGTAFLIDFKSGGKGVAIGKPAETDNLFDVGFPTKFNNTVSIGANKIITKRCLVPQGASSSYWYKFASISCPNTNENDIRISFKVTTAWGVSTTYGIISASIRVYNNLFVGANTFVLESATGSNLVADNFVMAYSSAETELWVKANEIYQFEVISESTKYKACCDSDEEWTLYDQCSDNYASAPTDGYTLFHCVNKCVINNAGEPIQFGLASNYVGFDSCGKENWLRSPSGGILPNSSDTISGRSSLGTTVWPFKAVYAKAIWENGSYLSNRYLLQSGGTVTGYFFVNNDYATIVTNRFAPEWIGFYASSDNATNASNRKGWIGHDGSTNFTVNNEAGGSNITNKAWTTSSDERLKKDIDDIPEIFVEIWKELQPKVFKWNDHNGGGDKYQFGLIAQDVIAAFERYGVDYKDYDFIVPYTNKGTEYFTVTYDHYHMLTSMVLKKVNDRLNDLQAQIDELKRLIKEE